MRPPFGNPLDDPLDLKRLASYAANVSPETLAEESRGWSIDLLDQLAIAETLFRYLKKDDHALQLYLEWLQDVDLRHARARSDVGPAFANMAKLLEARETFGMALVAYRRALECGCDDPYVKTHFAVLLLEQAPGEALRLVNEVLALPEEEILRWLPASATGALRQMRDDLTSNPTSDPGSLTLSVLAWGFDDGLQPVPNRIFETSLKTLVENGADPELVRGLRSAVIFSVSPDRKVWYTALYRAVAPATPAQLKPNGTWGDLQVWFYMNSSDDSIRGLSVYPRGKPRE